MRWDEYFINIAKVVALKSKDPSTKVGAVIADSDNKPVSFGFNGFLAGANESFMTHDRPMKYHLVCHAEMNALIFARRNLNGCKVYCTHDPCVNCLKHLLQAGIREFVYLNDYDDGNQEAKDILLKSTNAIRRKFEQLCS